MSGLVDTIEDTTNDSCKDTWEIKHFFQSLIDKKELRVYNFEINEKLIEKDTEDEKVVRTIKGITLKPTNNIYPCSASGSYFFEDPATGIKYTVEMDFRSSTSDFEPLEHKYGHCSITRLVKNPDLRKLNTFFSQLDIPKEMIDGKFYYGWTDNVRKGSHHEKWGHLTIEGEQDELFEKVCGFVRSK